MTVFPLILIRTAGLPFDAIEPFQGNFTTAFNALQVLRQEENVLHGEALQAMTNVLTRLPEGAIRSILYNTRRDFFNHRYTGLGRLRKTVAQQDDTMRLLFTDVQRTLNSWYQKMDERGYREQSIREDCAAITLRSYEALQKIVSADDSPLRRALLFSSHDLLKALPGFIQKIPAEFTKKERSVAASLAEYLFRAIAKTSPLSRFTTVSVWRFLEQKVATTSEMLEADLFDTPKHAVSPNVGLLPLLYEVLLRDPCFYRSLAIQLNPTLRFGHPFVWLYFDGEQESFQQIQPNPAVDFLVKALLTQERTMRFPDLLLHLAEEVEASHEQLENFVFKLIDIGLLEWRLPEYGLSPGWCGNLYNYLGYLPSSPVLTDAAALLQWLRTAARTLPFQSMGVAQATQQEALQEVQSFFDQYDDIRLTERSVSQRLGLKVAEQIFFEDVEQSVQVDVPSEALQQLITDLASCWQQRVLHTQPPFRARLFSFARRTLSVGQALDFLTFCQQFLAEPATDSGIQVPVDAPRYRGKIGVLFQIFEENGAYKAVVNGLFPGGGKLFARWLHLFPAGAREALEQWSNTAPFAWQGWSNANFQPPLSFQNLLVPGGRTTPLLNGVSWPLADFEVRLSNENIPQLVHSQTGEALICTDLGLEAPETRSPAMQVLWHLTVPFVSKEMLLSDTDKWREEPWGWLWPQVQYGSLVLQRQMWGVRPEEWKTWMTAADGEFYFHYSVRLALTRMGAPIQFFAQFSQGKDKPVWVDCDTPLMMALFQKMLRSGEGLLVLTEMLPTPVQCVVARGGKRAAEFVVEFEV